jgi:cytochrome b subunit of formate dehydrogenase
MGMEEKKEAGVSTWVWVVVIAIAVALVAGFIIFLRP